MFIYNEKTKVNMQFKMLELFRTIKADKLIKADAGNVVKVTLSNVLSPERTMMESSKNVQEIYIFDIELNSNKVPENFLEALNKSINFQTLIKLHYNNVVKYVVSIKIFNEEKIKLLKTFETDWQKEEFKEFPITNKLENVFKEMVCFITHYHFRQDEEFEDYVERLFNIKKCKSEIEKQTKTMNNEKQPNIRMKLNDEIKHMKKELQKLEV